MEHSVYAKSLQYADQAEHEMLFSPEKNKFLREVIADGPAFKQRLAHSKQQVDHAVTAEITKLNSKVAELQIRLQVEQQRYLHFETKSAQEKEQLGKELDCLRSLLAANQAQKEEMLLRRNEDYRLQLERILGGHQQAIIGYESQVAELEAELKDKLELLRERDRAIQAVESQKQATEVRARQLSQNLSSKFQVENDLRARLQKEVESNAKRAAETRAAYEEGLATVAEDRLRDNIEHARELQTQKQVHKMELVRLQQENDARYDQLSQLLRIRQAEADSLSAKLKEEAESALGMLRKKEAECQQARAESNLIAGQLAMKAQDLASLQKQFLGFRRLCEQERSASNGFQKEESAQLREQVAGLKGEMVKMRDILIESSNEMEKCRAQIVRGEQERDLLEQELRKMQEIYLEKCREVEKAYSLRRW